MSEKNNNSSKERLDRILQELAEEKISVVSDFGLKDLALQFFLEELSYALRPPVHERHVPSYAAIIDTNRTVESVGTGHEFNLLRKFADGHGSFLVRSVGGSGEVVFEDITNEWVCIEICKKYDSPFIRRSYDGTVSIFSKKFVYVLDKGIWFRKRYASELTKDLQKLAGMGNPEAIRNIAEFCVHYLSVKNIGATLVLWLDDESSCLDTAGRSKGKELVYPKFRLARENYPAISSVLAQIDRSVFFEYDGTFAEMEAEFQSSTLAKSVVVQDKGTRHTSSKRFSFDQPRALVFTVSVDGPVSVFSDGRMVSEAGFVKPHLYPEYDSSKVGNKTDSMIGISRDFVEQTCSNCQKKILIDFDKSPADGWEHHEIACPVCGNILRTKFCYSIDTRVCKVFTGK